MQTITSGEILQTNLNCSLSLTILPSRSLPLEKIYSYIYIRRDKANCHECRFCCTMLMCTMNTDKKGINFYVLKLHFLHLYLLNHYKKSTVTFSKAFCSFNLFVKVTKSHFKLRLGKINGMEVLENLRKSPLMNCKKPLIFLTLNETD